MIWFDLAFLVIILTMLLCSMKKEPTLGWDCIKCKKKWLGTEAQIKDAGWDFESNICPKCRS
jgi:hypothetical protein